MARILMIEDDSLITGPVVEALQDAGHEVLTASDGKRGLELALTRQPHLVLLDIMLPQMDGWQVCKTIRAQSTVPIVMVTALNEEVDRILGLELGADDYLTKPFSTRELLARVRATLRRVEFEHQDEKPPSELIIGDVRLDLEARRAFKGKQELTLRYKEFELLSLLMSRAGEAVSRADLFDEVWGTEWLGDTRTLDVHVRWLREKLEDDPGKPVYVQTVRGVGYRFFTPDEDPS
jgi:DNA-binding response OmpR family regulator